MLLSVQEVYGNAVQGPAEQTLHANVPCRSLPTGMRHMERTHLGGQRPPDLAEVSLQLISYHLWSHSSESDLDDNLWFSRKRAGKGETSETKAAGRLQQA